MGDYALIGRDILEDMLDKCKDKIDMLKYYYKITDHDMDNYSVMWTHDKTRRGGRTTRKRRKRKKRRRKKNRTKRRKIVTLQKK